MIHKLAVLLTCHNRKGKTLTCLNKLFLAYKTVRTQLEITIFLTDDGSTDGTGEAVKALFPDTVILTGNGDLFWAGGMRNSWIEALQNNFDAYLLINDDTNVFENLFNELLATHEYAMERYNCGGIYIGSTHDSVNQFSYGGSLVKNTFFNTYTQLHPNRNIREVDLGNANIMMVTREVVLKIGILSTSYTHGLADFDYTLSAKRENLPVLITANYCGMCDRDHADKNKIFASLSFAERKRFLFKPKGFALSDELKFMRKFYPFRLPIIIFGATIKLLFPQFYIKLSNLRNRK